MSKKVLFIGAIDGKVELEFLTRMGFERCEVYLTSYLAGPELKRLAKEYKGEHTLHAKQNVDGTKLKERFKGNLMFEAIAWLGPTNDTNKGETAALVQSFTQSAASVLKPGGVVYVLQDLRTPNFRPIVKIPGAHFLCEISLEGRTVTQTSTSTSKKVMEGRKDHLFAFQFDEGALPRDVNNLGNQQFEEILSMLMSSRSEQLKKGSYKQGQGAHSKKEIADLIFEFASHT